MTFNWLIARASNPMCIPVRARLQVEALEDRLVPATLLALTTTQQLLTFDSASPNQIVQSPVITNLSAAGEKIVSIDSRPANGVVYGLSNRNLLYTLDPSSAVATRVGTGDALKALVGTRVGIDFNPTVDRLRIDSNVAENFRINPITGDIIDGNAGARGTQFDIDLAYAAGDIKEGIIPSVVEVAYDRNFQGATQTTLFGIDATTNSLVRIGSINGTPNSPNGGQMNTIGGLGLNIGTKVGFEITADGEVFASLLNPAGVTRLYTIDLVTGLATKVGKLGAGTVQIIGLTELPREEIVFATTTANRLISFRASDPNTLLTSQAITGLIGTESIAGLDFRPLTGVLFALTSTNRVLTIDTTTAVATQAATIGDFFNPPAADAGFDFNPAIGRARLAYADNVNALFVPDFNFFTLHTDLAYITGDANAGADPNVVAVAHDRNDNNGATATTQFAIDSTLNILVRQGAVDGNDADLAGGRNPNLGLLTTLGSLGVDPTDRVGFDISDVGTLGNGAALAVMQLEGEQSSKLFQINLTAGLANQALGTATLIGIVGGGDILITAMAIAPSQI